VQIVTELDEDRAPRRGSPERALATDAPKMDLAALPMREAAMLLQLVHHALRGRLTPTLRRSQNS
jgi:hypothetical protein